MWLTRLTRLAGEMNGAGGEMVGLGACIAGEMQPGDVPLNPAMDVAALKAGDAEPMEVVVEIPAGKSKRGWDYRPEALQAIVGEVMSQGLPGFLGHQKAEDVDSQFPAPVTHWVGAKWDAAAGKAYFRGVIDKAAADLKRWIKGKAIKTVSIFGVPKLRQAGGETHVVDYKPLSIDWTPLGRAGMPTAVVATGEMGGNNDGGESMNWKELVAQLKTMLAAGDVTLGQVVGEMGLSADVVAGEMAEVKAAMDAADTLGKVKEALGVSGEMDVLEVAKKAREAAEAQAKGEHIKLVTDTVAEKVNGEMAQGLVMKMLNVPEDAAKEQIAGEIDKLLADEMIKAAIGKFHVDKPPAVGGSSGGGNEATTLRVKRQTI